MSGAFVCGKGCHEIKNKCVYCMCVCLCVGALSEHFIRYLLHLFFRLIGLLLL